MPGLKPEDVRTIVGKLDDQCITEILALEPTAAELMQAVAWLLDDDAARKAVMELPSGRVTQICEILTADDATEEEERRS